MQYVNIFDKFNSGRNIQILRGQIDEVLISSWTELDFLGLCTYIRLQVHSLPSFSSMVNAKPFSVEAFLID